MLVLSSNITEALFSISYMRIERTGRESHLQGRFISLLAYLWVPLARSIIGPIFQDGLRRTRNPVFGTTECP
jgi:hypothetical protein